LQSSLATNTKLIAEIKNSNKELEEPLKEREAIRDKLKDDLKQHPKDKMSLANLNIKLNTLNEKINKLKKEQEDLDKRYSQVVFK
jgi:predicted nuclease with TOPRIM domain